MATELHSTAKYKVFVMRGAGVVLRNANTGKEVFFQPGDDAGEMYATLEALQEVNEARRDAVFDMVASQYV